MNYDVIVIGAGQSGLAMGYYLKQSNLSFLITDQSKEIGESWRNRYDSLTLFTPHSYSSLPGFHLEGNISKYPTKDEIADYLTSYATRFSLPVKLDTKVNSLSFNNDTYHLKTNRGNLYAKKVIVATGSFQTPNIPSFSKLLSENVLQLHTSAYKNPSQLKSGSVLVVGAGNSGAQIAYELSKDRNVYLSASRRLTFLPLQIGPKSIFWFIEKLGIYKVRKDSTIGKCLRAKNDPIFGFELKRQLKKRLVLLKPRTTSVNKDVFSFKDGSRIKVRNVIWATGYKPNFNEWIHLPNAFHRNGEPIHYRGKSPIEGLFFLGLPWLHNRGSALIQGVGDDARYLYEYLNNKTRH